MGLTVASWALSVTLAGQAVPGALQMAEDVFKNVQVLKGIPVDEFMGTMGFFSAALGLNCTDCHVDESGGSWARYADDNDLKRTTRRMVQMVAAINKGNFAGRQVVTCNTCHRGSSRPNVMPSLALLYGSPPPDEPGDPFEQAPGQPPADQILDKYLQAVGGPERVGDAHQLHRQGVLQRVRRRGQERDGGLREGAGPADDHRPYAQPVTARRWSVLPARGSQRPQAEKPVPLITITGQDLDGVRLEAALVFPGAHQGRLEQVAGRPVRHHRRPRSARRSRDDGGWRAVTLCFDAKTSLLVRLVRFSESPVGRLVTRVDYETIATSLA